ncbi:hypothetical protein, partial [Pseudomonas veronii]|uniref:DUF5983 family protein n=1 Tax=Pseudomonas veronii TaxID=76761 RepID=UPI001E40CE4A
LSWLIWRAFRRGCWPDGYCKSVELCTNHLRKSDAELLEHLAARHFQRFHCEGWTGPVVLKNRYGFVIPIGELTVRGIIESGASTEFRDILNWCISPEKNVTYLGFDRDGYQDEDVPQFEW